MAFQQASIRRLLPRRLKEGLGEVLCSPAAGSAIGRLFGDRIPLGRMRFDTGAACISPRTKAQILWGIYESAEIRFVERFLEPSRDVLEIGSSLGVVGCFVARRLADSARLSCVEANPALIPIIEGNLRSNHPGREVRVLNLAVVGADAPPMIELQIGDTTAASRMVCDGSDRAGTVRVPGISLDGLHERVGYDRFTLVSDVEGAEAGWILGDCACLQRCDQIIIELHDASFAGRSVTHEELLDALTGRHGFTVTASYGPVHVLDR
jgi:FkbM family methyltransferase